MYVDVREVRVKKTWGIATTLAWLLLAPFDAVAAEERAGEGEEADEELPDPVDRAVRGVVADPRILSARRVGEAWRVSVLVGDHREELAFSEDGDWLARSRRVRRDAVPSDVGRTLDRRYARAALWRIDLHQFPVGDVYVVHASRGADRVEACLAADGSLLGERLLGDDEEA